MFVMKGGRSKKAYMDALLVEHGCDPGWTITMTDNVYMTDEAWFVITKSIVDRYWKIPLIR